jgi:hypothetical protein
VTDAGQGRPERRGSESQRHEPGASSDGLLAAAANLSRYHREHEKYYSEAPLTDAIALQRAARTLIALAERWSAVEPAAVPAGSPFAGSPDLNDDRAIETSGVLFMEGGGEPAEITRIKSELQAIAASGEQSGAWLAAAMEASWAMAEVLLSYPQLADLLAERYKIIGNNWQNASTAQLIARYLRRAVSIMEQVDFTPAGLRGGPRQRTHRAGLPLLGSRTDQPRRRPVGGNLCAHPRERAPLADLPQANQADHRSRLRRPAELRPGPRSSCGGTDGTSPAGMAADPGRVDTARPGRAQQGDGRDDVLVRRRLGVVAGWPDVGRHDRVLGFFDLGHLRSGHGRYPAARLARPGRRALRRRCAAHPGRAAGPRRDRHRRLPAAARRRGFTRKTAVLQAAEAADDGLPAGQQEHAFPGNGSRYCSPSAKQRSEEANDGFREAGRM